MTTIQSKKQAAAKENGNGRAIGGVASMNAYVKSIADIMRRSGRADALQYVPEMTWTIFLRILDEREQREAAAPLQARAKTLLAEADRLQKAIGKLKPQLRQAAVRL